MKPAMHTPYRLVALYLHRHRHLHRRGLGCLCAALLLGACAVPELSRSSQTRAFEGVPLQVSLEAQPDASVLVSVREVGERAQAGTLDAMRLYQQAASQVVAPHCGSISVAELQTETRRQGVAGRDYVFKCSLPRLDRSQPQTLLPPR